MTIDLRLKSNNDLDFSKNYTITGLEKTRQQIIVRLKWFLREWKFNKNIGIPYFEEILGKTNPNYLRIFALIKFELEKIENVLNVEIIDYNLEEINRLLKINLKPTSN
jgi:hypothetical protein